MNGVEDHRRVKETITHVADIKNQGHRTCGRKRGVDLLKSGDPGVRKAAKEDIIYPGRVFGEDIKVGTIRSLGHVIEERTIDRG